MAGGAVATNFAAGRAVAARSVAAEISRSIDPPFLKDQNPTGNEEVQCCVSAAMCIAMECAGHSSNRTELAELYIHYFATNGDPERGVSIVEAKTALQFWGVCDRSLHPYEVTFDNARRPPSGEARVNAAPREGMQFSSILPPTDLSAWRSMLNRGIPLVLVFHLYPDLYARIPANDYMHPPLVGSPSDRGHAVTVIGYDDFQECFLVQDCQGTRRGNGGRWWLPYGIASSIGFTADLVYHDK